MAARAAKAAKRKTSKSAAAKPARKKKVAASPKTAKKATGGRAKTTKRAAKTGGAKKRGAAPAGKTARAAKPRAKGAKSAKKKSKASKARTAAKTANKTAKNKKKTTAARPRKASSKTTARKASRAGAAPETRRRKTRPRRRSPKEFEPFRRQLLAKQRDLTQAYAASKGDTRVRADDGTEDYIDYAVSSYAREFLLSLSELDRKQLSLVEDALRRLHRGDYGRCLHCGRTIARKRLEVAPWARYCLRCQELEERGLLLEEDAEDGAAEGDENEPAFEELDELDDDDAYDELDDGEDEESDDESLGGGRSVEA